MRYIIVIFVALSLAFTINAKGIEKSKKIDKAQIETNLFNGLKSDNFGLKSSSAFMLGEIKSEKAIIPLMEILKSSDNESLRILAALSLMKIGDARGLFAVKRAARFDISERVRRLCRNFHYAALNSGV